MWERCPDGVELVRPGPNQDGTYLPKTDRVESVTYEANDLTNLIVLHFLNASRADGSKFFSRFGMLMKREKTPEWQFANIKDILGGALFDVNEADEASRLAKLNQQFLASGTSLQPVMQFKDGKPQLYLQPSALYHFMLMEVATAAHAGASAAHCEHCHKVFLTGPLTGRRGHAKYCSDRCRVAAMRKRNFEGN
jgi:hypothetical protein